MKRFNKYLLTVFALSSILLASCEEDDKLANQIIIDGEKIALGNGYIVNYGWDIDFNDDPMSEYDIILSASGLSFNGCSSEGDGTYFDLEISSPTTYKLENGTYEFIFEQSDEASKVEGTVVLNYDAETGLADDYLYVMSGKMSISRSGKIFKIKFTNLMLYRSSDGAEIDASGSWEAELEDAIYNCG